MGSFRDLRVWRASISLIVQIYRVSAAFPGAERFGLTAQLRRASVSIAANIAEGHGRMTTGEWLQFLGHARGSLYEVETHLEVALLLGFIEPERHMDLAAEARAIGRALTGLIRSVEARQPRKPKTENRQPKTNGPLHER